MFFLSQERKIISSVEEFGDGFGIGILKTKQMEKNIGFRVKTQDCIRKGKKNLMYYLLQPPNVYIVIMS